MRFYGIASIALFLEFLGIIVAIIQHYYRRDTNGIKPILTTAILILVTLLRDYFIRRNGQRIALILNELEKIFPHSQELQQHYQVHITLKCLFRRFRAFESFAVTAVICFNSKAFYSFFMAFRTESPLNDDCFAIPSWYPYELKRSYAWYPLIFIIESTLTLSGAAFTFNWNHTCSMVFTLLCEHYNHIAKDLGDINAKDSRSGLTSRKLQSRIYELMKQLQRLDNLCVDTNAAFVTPLIIIDAICTTTICLQVFIIKHEHLVSIVHHILPMFIISFMIYDTSRYGESLEQASNNVRDSIYNHNWYDGTLEHRKWVLALLQWRSEPRRLSWGKSFFNINLAYFVQIVTMAYELYSFLQSLE